MASSSLACASSFRKEWAPRSRGDIEVPLDLGLAAPALTDDYNSNADSEKRGGQWENLSLPVRAHTSTQIALRYR